MSVLVTRCQQRADKENDGQIGSSEWKALVSEKYGELYGLVCEVGLRYFETTSTITATGANSYSEPTDHLSTVGLALISSDGTQTPLLELMPSEVPSYAGLTGEARYYTLVDDQIYLYPKPTSGTYRLTYIPQSPDLSAYLDADLVDVVNPDGEAFLIWGVSILAKSKSESDVQLALQREAAARERLLSWASQRAISEPRRRIARDAFYDPFGDGGWSQ